MIALAPPPLQQKLDVRCVLRLSEEKTHFKGAQNILGGEIYWEEKGANFSGQN